MQIHVWSVHIHVVKPSWIVSLPVKFDRNQYNSCSFYLVYMDGLLHQQTSTFLFKQYLLFLNDKAMSLSSRTFHLTESVISK